MVGDCMGECRCVRHRLPKHFHAVAFAGDAGVGEHAARSDVNSRGFASAWIVPSSTFFVSGTELFLKVKIFVNCRRIWELKWAGNSRWCNTEHLE